MSLNKFKSIIVNGVKWLAIYLIVGGMVGSATAFFLQSLDYVTLLHTNHIWMVNFLPIAGLMIGLL